MVLLLEYGITLMRVAAAALQGNHPCRIGASAHISPFHCAEVGTIGRYGIRGGVGTPPAGSIAEKYSSFYRVRGTLPLGGAARAGCDRARLVPALEGDRHSRALSGPVPAGESEP